MADEKTFDWLGPDQVTIHIGTGPLEWWKQAWGDEWGKTQPLTAPSRGEYSDTDASTSHTSDSSSCDP